LGEQCKRASSLNSPARARVGHGRWPRASIQLARHPTWNRSSAHRQAVIWPLTPTGTFTFRAPALRAERMSCVIHYAAPAGFPQGSGVGVSGVFTRRCRKKTGNPQPGTLTFRPGTLTFQIRHFDIPARHFDIPNPALTHSKSGTLTFHFVTLNNRNYLLLNDF
jgi:hypothetical protein